MRAFGALTTPWKVSTGGFAATDDESQAAWYVETTLGFEKAKEVLVWRYQRCRELIDFPISGPGEGLVRALLRRSWGDMLGRKPYQIARGIHDEFFEALTVRIQEQPFRPIRAEEPEDSLEMAEAQNSRYARPETTRLGAYCCEAGPELL